MFLGACQLPFAPTVAPVARNHYLPPEYEPIQGLLISEHLASFPNGQVLLKTLLEQNLDIWFLSANAQNIAATQEILSARFGIASDQMARFKPLPIATQTVWARDWAPLFTFSTLAPDQVGLMDFRYYPDRPVDDAVAQNMLHFLNTSATNPALSELFPKLRYEQLPVNVELEGGNLMCTRENCFMTEEVLQRIENRTGKTGDAEQVVFELEKYLEQEVWIVPRIPSESTGHIDIWAKFLSRDRVIIGEISTESLNQVPEFQREKYLAVQAFLEEQATGLKADGSESPQALASVLKREEPEIQILRIPMPTPGVYQGSDVFRTYTNSLLLNQVAIVPRYGQGSRARIGNRQLNLQQEARVQALYEEAGFQVIWIPADNLIRDGGAWHCVSMQIPRLPN
ncbi:MAG: agmatine deiminase family protein [Candidatus Sericytochromatia bacterium]